MTQSVLSSDQPSVLSVQTLQRLDLYDLYDENPVEALRLLHAGLEPSGDRYRLFALAELSYAYAERSRDRSYYLAAAVYAYALLFSEIPDDASLDPSDPRLRMACELYNRGLAEAFATGEDGSLELRTDTKILPFGAMDIDAASSTLSWGGYQISRFDAAANLEVNGLRNRYRRAGIGAPLIAGLAKADTPQDVVGHRRIPKNVKVPVAVFLRIENPRGTLAKGWLRARLEVYPYDEFPRVQVSGHDWPLESEGSSALASTLSESSWWDFEYAGFFSAAVNPWGDKAKRDGLLLVQPYLKGRIPLVLVHGTASSPGRWADLMNELQIDDRIADRYQVWLYMYNSGNPIGYSAGVMREALERAVAEFDPSGEDPALHGWW